MPRAQPVESRATPRLESNFICVLLVSHAISCEYNVTIMSAPHFSIFREHMYNFQRRIYLFILLESDIIIN